MYKNPFKNRVYRDVVNVFPSLQRTSLWRWSTRGESTRFRRPPLPDRRSSSGSFEPSKFAFTYLTWMHRWLPSFVSFVYHILALTERTVQSISPFSSSHFGWLEFSSVKVSFSQLNHQALSSGGLMPTLLSKNNILINRDKMQL